MAPFEPISTPQDDSKLFFFFPQEGQTTSTRLMAPAGSARIGEHRDSLRAHGVPSTYCAARDAIGFGATPRPPPRSWAARDRAKPAHARTDGSPSMVAHLGRAETQVGGGLPLVGTGRTCRFSSVARPVSWGGCQAGAVSSGIPRPRSPRSGSLRARNRAANHPPAAPSLPGTGLLPESRTWRAVGHPIGTGLGWPKQ